MTLRSRFFAMTYDRQMTKVEKAGLRACREGLLAGAAGQVLEIGAGTGSNLRFYGPTVESLTLTEPETPMLRRLERKAAEQAPGATVLRAPAEDLPFEDATFDVAVSTLVLCDCNRPTLDSIREAGLTVTRAEHMTLPKVFRFVSPAIAGSATVPAPVPSPDARPGGGTRS
jgi:SAM-dependent methyltransferase